MVVTSHLQIAKQRWSAIHIFAEATDSKDDRVTVGTVEGRQGKEENV